MRYFTKRTVLRPHSFLFWNAIRRFFHEIRFFLPGLRALRRRNGWRKAQKHHDDEDRQQEIKKRFFPIEFGKDHRSQMGPRRRNSRRRMHSSELNHAFVSVSFGHGDTQTLGHSSLNYNGETFAGWLSTRFRQGYPEHTQHIVGTMHHSDTGTRRLGND